MIRTHGLTHVSPSVRDPEAALGFYRALFGVREYYRDENVIQVLGPGEHDVIVFERRSGSGVRGAIDHIGFRLVSPDDVDAVVEQVEAAGGTVLRRGEHCPGEPFVHVADPDGNEIEIWYEAASLSGEGGGETR